MLILALMGSRNEKGRTARAVDALLHGAERKGVEVEKVFLPLKELARCRQCDENGWGICRLDGECVLQDDFDWITRRVRDAHAVVFATPVYFSELSESLRAYLDRLRRTCTHENGRAGITDKPAIGLCMAGGGGGGAPACARSLEVYLQKCGFDILDMIPLRRQNLEMKLKLLEATGKWLTKSLSS